MKIRIASSIALAAGLLLGASGCGLMAPQATTEAYAPSDGIDVNVGEIDLRNVLLIADETGENFNVVFSSVNDSGSVADLSMTFEGEGGKVASADFAVPTGVGKFGNPEGEIAPVLVTIDGLKAGATVSTYFQLPGAAEVQYDVPVLDGELKEYANYVLPANYSADAKSDVKQSDAEKAAELVDADEALAGNDPEAEAK